MMTVMVRVAEQPTDRPTDSTTIDYGTYKDDKKKQQNRKGKEEGRQRQQQQNKSWKKMLCEEFKSKIRQRRSNFMWCAKCNVSSCIYNYWPVYDTNNNHDHDSQPTDIFDYYLFIFYLKLFSGMKIYGQTVALRQWYVAFIYLSSYRVCVWMMMTTWLTLFNEVVVVLLLMMILKESRNNPIFQAINST